MRLLLLSIFSLFAVQAFSQGYIEAGYTPSRGFMDDDNKTHGSGDMWQILGRYTLPFSMQKNDEGRPIVWSGTFSGMYAFMNNKGMAAEINPEQVLNFSFNVSHLRPISKRWYMMASLGAGVYSAPNEISFKSILANGAVIFAYRLRENLDIGIGVGLTNSYGVPIIMPMGFLKWTTTGRYEINVEIASALKVSLSRRFGSRFKLSLVPCDMDGMSSVVKIDGKHKIYGVTRLRTYLRPELRIGENSFVYLNVGGEMSHSVRIAERSLKGFADSFKGKNSWSFDNAFNIMAGFKYGF